MAERAPPGDLNRRSHSGVAEPAFASRIFAPDQVTIGSKKPT
jgi:hypothetical protein